MFGCGPSEEKQGHEAVRHSLQASSKVVCLGVSLDGLGISPRARCGPSASAFRAAMASPSSIEDEARRFLKELQVDPKSREELQAAAKLHRDKKACTEKTDSGELKYKSCCGTGAAELGKFCGVGVRLYFSFIKQMGFVFFLCAVVLSFNLACNIMGNMVNENSALYKFLGSTTIGNLGACEGGRCATDEELQDRCLFNQFPCELRLREATQWLGLADGIGILFVLAWGIYFQNRFIPRVVKAQDEASLTPPDFAVDISVLPYRLAEGHEEGALGLQRWEEGVETVARSCSIAAFEGIWAAFKGSRFVPGLRTTKRS